MYCYSIGFQISAFLLEQEEKIERVSKITLTLDKSGNKTCNQIGLEQVSIMIEYLHDSDRYLQL